MGRGILQGHNNKIRPSASFMINRTQLKSNDLFQESKVCIDRYIDLPSL